MQVMVPLFHLRAHKVECQDRFNSRQLIGAGLVAGEMTETLWSVIGRFGYIIREMAQSMRLDLFNHLLQTFADDTNDVMVERVIDHYTVANMLISRHAETVASHANQLAVSDLRAKRQQRIQR